MAERSYPLEKKVYSSTSVCCGNKCNLAIFYAIIGRYLSLYKYSNPATAHPDHFIGVVERESAKKEELIIVWQHQRPLPTDSGCHCGAITQLPGWQLAVEMSSLR